MSLTLLKLFGISIFCLACLVGRIYAQETLNPIPKPDDLGEEVSPFGYYEYLPINYRADTTIDFPLIIYLHGLGDKGNGTNELDSVLRSGVAHFLDIGNDIPFLVMTPQSNIGWWDNDGVNAFLDFILDNYRVDSHRIYMTGLSAGGIGVFSYAAAYPDRLAAIVPITGKANNIDVCDLSTVPTWAFHNEDDPVFNPKFSINSVAELNACQPTPSPLAKVTIYPSGGHDAWTKTYDGTGRGTEDPQYDPFEIDVFDWMLQFAKDTFITDFGEDQTLFYPENDILIKNYAASPDGQHSYSWTQLTGPDLGVEEQRKGNLNYQNVPTGNYRFLLTITDNFGHRASDTIKVNVRPPNEAPRVKAGMDRTLLLPFDSIVFDGIISDPEQDSITSEWVQITDTANIVLQKNQEQLVLRHLKAGSYILQLSATDQYDSTGSDVIQLLVVNSPEQTISRLPYANSFEEMSEEAWQGYGTSNSWEQGEPGGNVINEPADESKVWATNLVGEYQAEESSFLLSPIFDFSNLTNDPSIQYDVWADISPGDSVYLSVTSNQGATWKSYDLTEGNSNDGWVRVSHILEGTAGQDSVLFRIGLEANNTEGHEGIAIDNMIVCSAGSIVSLADTTVIGGESLEIPIELDNSDIVEATYQVNSSNQEILPDGNIVISEGILQIRSLPQIEGETEITVSSPDACINKSSFKLTVARVTALDKPENLPPVQLYPNPSTGYYQIKSRKAIQEVRVYNPEGQLIEKYLVKTSSNNELSFDIYDQPNGIYYLQVETAENVLTRKVVKY